MRTNRVSEPETLTPMPHVIDFHTHSRHSVDSAILVQDLVDSAKRNNPAITHMALTDHNTYSGCVTFLEACMLQGIEGFVSSEISGSHPDFPGVEIHFLTTFGTEWTESVARRVDLFWPHFNAISRAYAENLFRFLDGANRLGIRIGYRQVVQKAVEFYHDLPEPRDPGMISPPDFHHLRQLLREGDYGEKSVSGRTDLEQRVWQETKISPVPTPTILEAYAIYKQARPAVALSHPMLYGKTPSEMRPYLREWQHEMGLIAIECHYKNTLHAEWKAVADELGLLVTAGSDRHGAYVTDEPRASVPVVGDEQGDIAALLDLMRAAGQS